MAGRSTAPLVLVGSQEFAAVYGVPARNTAQWIQRGLLDYQEAVIVSGRAYWPIGAAVAFGESAERPRTPDMAYVEQLVAEQAPGRSAKTALAVRAKDLPPIVGIQEVLALTGEDPTKGKLVTDAVTKGVFTSPDWRLSGSPLWLLPNALTGLDRMRERPKSRPLVVIPEVLAALENGTYDGPGSQVLTRGQRADS
ncbi:hypothetical protein OG196_14185 [Kitasatospora purpeofusca]|uniref:hypothetical protein n=1 Tax=Kitasatospora purpeofusca TaxID=67352 RepID=UPI002E15528D|nr:hypothetical protein OG196_14185 [Kitasatospora purpeofusca]